MIINFTCEYGTAKFSGYAYANELDDDDPLYFYGENLTTQTGLQNAYIAGNEEDRLRLYAAFVKDFLFIQFLADFADETKVIERPGYILKIN